jgi:uncharacterized DUF497 family protein
MGGDGFEWDDDKAQGNLAKHGISFEDARLVFRDVFASERPDVVGSDGEQRYITTGQGNGVLLTVVYTERNERIRIISARKATKHEQRDYYRS